MRIVGLLLLGTMSLTGIASAQSTGGSGVDPGSAPQNMPPSDPRSMNYNPYAPGTGTGPVAPTAPPVKWADRWGAIANDGNGNYGIVSDQPAETDARVAAINECRNRGGGGCRLDLIYHNQCAAVGSNSEVSFSYRAPTEREAIQGAVKLCESRTGRGTCHVYYSGCSLPVRAQ